MALGSKINQNNPNTTGSAKSAMQNAGTLKSTANAVAYIYKLIARK